MKIGVFDSGVGGLTVASALYKSGAFLEIYYLGDTARVPYGSKDANTVLRYALEAVEFFNGLDIDFLIVACNTVSVIALDQMRQFSAMPVFGVVEPGVQALANDFCVNKQAEVLVIATRSTINSNAYQNGIASLGFTNVTAIATPLLVSLVEENVNQGAILTETFNHYFCDVPKPDVVLLGCTHFPLLARQISEYFSGCKTLHSGDAMLQWLAQHYSLPLKISLPILHIHATENVEKVKSFAVSLGLKPL